MISLFASLTYLAISIALIIWVVRSLNRHSPILLAPVYDPDQQVSRSVTSMLVTSFYLLAIGLTVMNVRQSADLGLETSIELTSTKIGLVIVGLASAHFVVVGTLLVLRREIPSDPIGPPPLPKS